MRFAQGVDNQYLRSYGLTIKTYEELMKETDAVVQQILRCDQAAIESAKETVLDCASRRCGATRYAAAT